MSIDTRTAPTPAYNGAPPAGRPLPTRSHRPGLIATAVLLVVGFALGGALLVNRAGDTTTVLVAARPVPAGQVVTAADLTTAPVSGSVRAIAAADTDTVVGRTAAVGLVPGQVLNRDMLTTQVVPGPGQSTVGLALGPGRLPADGLQVGDTVQAIVVAPPGATDPTRADAGARVLAVGEVFALRPDPSSAADTLVTLVVSADAAARIATYGAAGQVALVKVGAEATR